MKPNTSNSVALSTEKKFVLSNLLLHELSRENVRIEVSHR